MDGSADPTDPAAAAAARGTSSGRGNRRCPSRICFVMGSIWYVNAVRAVKADGVPSCARPSSLSAGEAPLGGVGSGGASRWLGWLVDAM